MLRSRSLRGFKENTTRPAQSLAGIDRGLDDARQRRFATDEEVKAAFGKFRRA